MVYLTTHDLQWINKTLTGRNNPYNYITLEAAMAAQYGYLQSDDVTEQAARLLERLIGRRPFATGNTRTAFIATLTFLHANGYGLNVSDAEAAQMIASVGQGQINAPQAIAALAIPVGGTLPMGMTLRKLMMHECNTHQDALKALTPGD